jgi:hypothetical protein
VKGPAAVLRALSSGCHGRLCRCILTRLRLREKTEKKKEKEGEPTGLAPAVAFLTGTDGQDGRRRCASEA